MSGARRGRAAVVGGGGVRAATAPVGRAPAGRCVRVGTVWGDDVVGVVGESKRKQPADKDG